MSQRTSAILVGLVLLGGAGWTARRQYLVLTSWVPADAVVLTKPETVLSGTGRGATLKVQITFGYVVSATKYTGTAKIDPAQAERDSRAIQAGTHHSIRYDPANPSSAEYEPGLRLFEFPLLLGGAGSILLLVTILSGSATRGKPGSAVSAFDLNVPPRGAWFARLPGGFTASAVIRDPNAYVCAAVSLLFVGLAVAEYPSRASFFYLLFVLLSLYGAVRLGLGCVRLTLDMDRLTIFTGAGMIGSGMTYQWSSFRSVREQSLQIVLEGTGRAEFGRNLSAERREFLVNVLRAMLPAQQTKAVAATPETSESAGKSIERTCTICGGLVPASARFCAVCGIQADTIPAPLKPGSFEDDWSVPRELLLPVPRQVRKTSGRPTQRHNMVGIVFIVGVAALFLLSAGFFIGAVMVGLFAAWAYRVSSKRKRLLIWGKPARAVVAEVTHFGVSSPYFTIFEYRDDTGNRIRSSRQRLGDEFAVGRVMTVLYDPRKPSSCIMYPMENLEIALPKSS
jgi:uncharacterized membrane protein YiaA